ncbi:unnamed protein product [Penicillium manginii]
MDAFDELLPKIPTKTQKRAPNLIQLSKSVYLGVISHRSTNTRHNSDQQCLISDSRHESRLPRAERGRLLARVTDDEGKAMSVAETSEKHRDPSLTNGPGHYQIA